MWASTGSERNHRVSLVVIGYGVMAALVALLIVTGLAVVREKLVPQFETGGEDIILPSDLV